YLAEKTLTHWAMDIQLTRLVLKYCCGGKLPLQIEVSRCTWRLFIYKVTRVKSIDATTIHERITHLYTLVHEHYSCCDSNVDASHKYVRLSRRFLVRA
ncbi:MAG: hypothetical protein M3299_15720, partial [Thermoproteota archaeon]|nr:hypothetical protein [Thermoproteota archaeon]